MDVKNLFDDWASEVGNKYASRQWMLSKWENIEGINWPDEKIEAMLANITEALDLKKENSLIDLGCGGGWIKKRLVEHVKEIVGLDFSLKMLKNGIDVCCDKKFVCGDIANLPLKDASFDRALCYFVFINMLDDIIVKDSIDEVIRVLKPGGKAMISQLPDFSKSKDFDSAKSEYIDVCRNSFETGEDLRDVCRVPIKLFDKKNIEDLLKSKNVDYKLLDSFNPFYCEGKPKTVDWRFDIVLEKK